MLTGDNRRTAEAIGADLGIEVRAELLPQDKQRIVRELQALGRTVGKVGDGINDAPDVRGSPGTIRLAKLRLEVYFASQSSWDACMGDLDRALTDIAAIRSQVAAGTAFQGYGPATIAATGGLAVVTAAAQSIWLDDMPAPLVFFAGWVVTAIVAVILIGSEMLARSRRHHSGLADALIFSAIETFLPAGAAGALLSLVLFRFAPDFLWALPGMWQILVSLGLFAALHTLPRNVRWGAAWYFVAGLGTIAWAAEHRALAPWMMGLPFAIGQFLLAALLRAADKGQRDA